MRANEVLFDFLTFTVHGNFQAEEVIEKILRMDSTNFEYLAKGFNFYNRSMVLSDIRVLYDGMENMGICVNMSGRGCRAYEEYSGENILSLLERINQNPDINVTRLDIALDDKTGILDLNIMRQYADEGKYRTRLMSRNAQESFKGRNEEGAKSLYFGSPSSMYRIRIYDKAKQMGENFHWVRFEITLRQDYSAQAVKLLVESGNLGEAIVSGIIDDKFAFIEPDNNNISRCKKADWWAEFLGEIQTVKLTSKQKFYHDIDEHKKWLRESCGRVIAKVIAAVGEENFNKEIRDYGMGRLTVSDTAQINDYRRRKRNVN
jgi:DNA relaxase NicK